MLVPKVAALLHHLEIKGGKKSRERAFVRNVVTGVAGELQKVVDGVLLLG